MRANSSRAAAEKYWAQVTDVLEDNLILVLCCLREEFGFGEKRLNSLLDSVYAKAKEFNQMAKDEVLDIKTNEDRERFHSFTHELIKARAMEFMPREIYDFFYTAKKPTLSETRIASHTREKAEAQKERDNLKNVAEMQKKLQAARSWAQNNSGYNAAVGRMMKDDE